ncbi:hypothetical protein CDAR_525011 [Caerostris darwini]|uniref:Uncharacterized protein n=1 Tax=Caerostris darwini TaxID=1538125 RepID=A0AAV4R0U4_9ARAC|nr:hypothetical protein CDAR_525011 [Caerostris darwini]
MSPDNATACDERLHWPNAEESDPCAYRSSLELFYRLSRPRSRDGAPQKEPRSEKHDTSHRQYSLASSYLLRLCSSDSPKSV